MEKVRERKLLLHTRPRRPPRVRHTPLSHTRLLPLLRLLLPCLGLPRLPCLDRRRRRLGRARLERQVAALGRVRVVQEVAARDGVGLAREGAALEEEGLGADQGALWGCVGVVVEGGGQYNSKRGGGRESREGRRTRVRRFSYRATRVPPSFSTAAMADWDALETTICTLGVLKCSAPCVCVIVSSSGSAPSHARGEISGGAGSARRRGA